MLKVYIVKLSVCIIELTKHILVACAYGYGVHNVIDCSGVERDETACGWVW